MQHKKAISGALEPGEARHIPLRIPPGHDVRVYPSIRGAIDLVIHPESVTLQNSTMQRVYFMLVIATPAILFAEKLIGTVLHGVKDLRQANAVARRGK